MKAKYVPQGCSALLRKQQPNEVTLNIYIYILQCTYLFCGCSLFIFISVSIYFNSLYKEITYKYHFSPPDSLPCPQRHQGASCSKAPFTLFSATSVLGNTESQSPQCFSGSGTEGAAGMVF